MNLDVVTVTLGVVHTVRLIAENKDKQNAEAIVMMAVARRGVEEEFFVAVPHGYYKEGDTYIGNGLDTAADAERWGQGDELARDAAAETEEL